MRGEAPMEKLAALTSGWMAGTTPLHHRTASMMVRAAATVKRIQKVVRNRSWSLRAFLRVTSITTLEREVALANIRPIVNGFINAYLACFSSRLLENTGAINNVLP